MMGLRPKCYIPSHKVIGPLVLEKKILEGFLPYMAATLVMWPRPREQTFVPPSHWGSIWNLASIGPAVLEKKKFENGGRTEDDHGYIISSPMSLKAQVLKIRIGTFFRKKGFQRKIFIPADRPQIYSSVNGNRAILFLGLIWHGHTFWDTPVSY